MWRLALVPAAVLLAVQFALLHPAYVDDQYIFYRYAENWAAGEGLAFNPGERVEGFSSFLWTAILSGLELAGLSAESAAPVVGLLLGLACVALLGRAARRLAPDAPLAPLAIPLALAVPTGFAFYSASGMDTLLFATVLLAAISVLGELAEREAAGESSRAWTVAAVAALAALVLVRAEGFAYALALAAVAPLTVPAVARRRLLVLPAAACGLLAAALLVRQAVFDQWLPSAALAKGYVTHFLTEAVLHGGSLEPVRSGLSRGIDYLGTPLLAGLAALGIAFVIRARRVRRPPPLAVLALTGVVVGLLVIVAGAGDWMPHDRLLVPLLPLVLGLVAWTAGRTVPLVAAAAVAVALVGVHPDQLTADQPPLFEESRAIGEALAAAPGRPEVASHFAGRLAYEAGPDVYVLDIFGLTDIHNATKGEQWVPSFGRTDLDYSLGSFDVLITPRPSDAGHAMELARRRGEPPGGFVLLPGRWVRIGLYVIAERASPARAALERACRCPALIVDSRVVRALEEFDLDALRSAVPAGPP